MSWRAAAGVLDDYLVSLQVSGQAVHTMALLNSSPPHCCFRSLEAGRLYTAIIATRSGGLENQTSVQARTRQSQLSHLPYDHMTLSDLMTLSDTKPTAVRRACNCPEPQRHPLSKGRLTEGEIPVYLTCLTSH